MNILATNRQQTIEIDLVQIKRSLGLILEALGEENREVSLTIVDDEIISGINREYLGRDYPTNVIAFSMKEGEFGDINALLLGDIVISAETALRDAKGGDLSLHDEIDYLMIHGVLHLLGYDHELPGEAEQMRGKEKAIFFALKDYDLE